MKYVITGATSFIGIELIRLLLAKEEDVFAVCRRDSNSIGEISQGASIVKAEMAEYDRLHDHIPEADVFINLAWGGTGHDGRNVADVQQENISNTINALKVAYKMGCKLFVEAGSQAEYGSTMENQMESMDCNPFSEYGKAKLKVKEECFKLTEEMDGMKYIHLRIFSTYGENDHPWTLVMSCIDKMLRNEAVDLSPCTQNWNFIYSQDLVKILYNLCKNAINTKDFIHEIYNIASDDTRVLASFVKRMKKLCNSNSELNFGAVTPQNLVSLQPDISKMQKDSGFTSFSSFDNIIYKIIQKKNQQNP